MSRRGDGKAALELRGLHARLAVASRVHVWAVRPLGISTLVWRSNRGQRHSWKAVVLAGGPGPGLVGQKSGPGGGGLGQW